MHSYVIFNPNQEKNLLGYKVVDNSNYLNSVQNDGSLVLPSLSMYKCLLRKSFKTSIDTVGFSINEYQKVLP